jgi:hypothetical protein
VSRGAEHEYVWAYFNNTNEGHAIRKAWVNDWFVTTMLAEVVTPVRSAPGRLRLVTSPAGHRKDDRDR